MFIILKEKYFVFYYIIFFFINLSKIEKFRFKYNIIIFLYIIIVK